MEGVGRIKNKPFSRRKKRKGEEKRREEKRRRGRGSKRICIKKYRVYHNKYHIS